MIVRESPTDRPHTFTLSVFAALIAAVAEVAVRFTASHENFGLDQLFLALSVNVAVLGMVAVLALAMVSLACRVTAGVTGSAPQARAARRPFLAVGLVSATLIAATDFLGFEPGLSMAATLCGVSTAGCAAGAISRPLATWRPFRFALARFGIALTWILCVTGSVRAFGATYRHLQPWTSPPNVAPVKDQAAPPHIFVLVLDTLRFDRVGVYGESKLTPHLDRLAKSSIVYRNAISTAPWTLPMHASLFTGLYPHEHGVSWGHYRLDERQPVLAELLTERGYHTLAVSNNRLLSRDNGFARGFDLFLETPTDVHLKGWRLALRCATPRRIAEWLGLPQLVAEDAGSAWTNWLVKRHLKTQSAADRPLFAFINYFEPHDPYLPPQPYFESHLTPAQRDAARQLHQTQDDLAAHACGVTRTFDEDQIQLMAALYDAEVAYQDAMVGDLLKTLEESGLLQTSWLVVTSDHGELFGESNMVFHTAGSHYQLLHVPLIVRPPGGVEGRFVDAPVQPVDIFATLLEAAGGTLPPHVDRSHPLPLDDTATSPRSLCVSQTFGASISGLSVAQYRDLQMDFSRWMRWVTSVYADGFLLELNENGPQSLHDVRRDAAMKDNLLHQRPDVVKDILTRYREWTRDKQEGGPM